MSLLDFSVRTFAARRALALVCVAFIPITSVCLPFFIESASARIVVEVVKDILFVASAVSVWFLPLGSRMARDQPVVSSAAPTDDAAELRLDQDQARVVLEQTSDIVIQFDARGIIAYSGPSAPVCLQSGSSVFEALTPRSTERLRAVIQALSDEGTAGDAVAETVEGGFVTYRLKIDPSSRGTENRSLLLIATDISEYRVIERAFRAVQDRARRFFTRSPTIQLLVDPDDGIVVDANTAARVFYGFGQHELNALAFGQLDAIGLNALSPLRDASEAGRRIAYRSNHAHASGQRRDVEIQGQTVELDGRPLAHLVITDVTEAMRAANALRESEERFRTLVEHSPVGIAVLDLNGHITRANPALQDMVGYSSATLASMTLVSLTHPEDRQATIDAFQELIAENTETYRLEKRNICRDGRVLWVHLAAALVLDEAQQPQFVIATMIDISERKAAEQASHMSEERLRAIIDNSPAMIFLMDREGRHLLVNAKFEEITGLSEADVRGKKAADYLPQEVAETKAADNERVLKNGAPLTTEEITRLDGQDRCFMTVKFPLFRPDGKIYGLGAISTDITDHRVTQESLRQAQKMEAIGQLTGGVAHDFNNLLTVIQGNLEWLTERTGDDETSNRLIESALESSRMGASLTQRLLAFSRKQPLKPEVVGLQEIILRMDQILVHTLGENIAIETKIPGGLWHVTVDPQQLENSILNLVINARDAMAGGGTLSIELANHRIRAREEGRKGKEPGRYVQLSVSDTGKGMPQEVIDRAFEPFFTTKGVGKGSGLGLSMVYGFIKQSEGYIEIESVPTKGTKIIFYLPSAEAEAVPETQTQEADKLPGGNETILVVEDDPRVRKLAVSILEWLGYRIYEADNGPTAIETLGKYDDIDLVFSDIVMPGGTSGFDVANEARKLSPASRILYMSGYSFEEMSRLGVIPSEIELLAKPFTRRDLAHKVRAVLDSDAL